MNSKNTASLTHSKPFQKLKSQLLSAKNVLISTHVLPDGDGLGAERALYYYLKGAKKYCQILNQDPWPPRYQFLEPSELSNSPEESFDYDLWIIVDTNDPRRLGKLWSDFSSRVKNIAFLDHHQEISEISEIKYPDHATLVSDPTSSSIAELLHLLFEALKLTPIDYDTALGLYVSVMTDTNSFRYSRTTPLAHRIAADTIAAGVNPEEVYRAIYSSKEVSHVRLLGHLLQNVHLSSNGQIAWLEIDLALRKKYNASVDDTQSFLNLLLVLRDTEIICLFREEEDGKVRVSMKSKGKTSVSDVAMQLGGGGHEFAAGVALSSSLHACVQLVIGKLENKLKDLTQT